MIMILQSVWWWILVFSSNTSSINFKGSISKGEFIIFYLHFHLQKVRCGLVQFTVNYKCIAESWHCQLSHSGWWWIKILKDYWFGFLQQGVSFIYQVLFLMFKFHCLKTYYHQTLVAASFLLAVNYMISLICSHPLSLKTSCNIWLLFLIIQRPTYIYFL
jgi:hypothetical protein